MSNFCNGIRTVALHYFLSLITCLGLAGTAVAATSNVPVGLQTLDPSVADATISRVTSGSLDSRFTQSSFENAARHGDVFWLRIPGSPKPSPNTLPVLVIHAGLLHGVDVFAAGEKTTQQLPPAGHIPEFAGARDTAFLLPTDEAPVYVRITPPGSGYSVPRVTVTTLDKFLAEGARRARTITLAFGALAAMATASLLIWIVLTERAFILYFTLFALQALYVAYFSGQGFEWPGLSVATPLTFYNWNILSALSGAAACLFVRDIADLRRFLPGSYAVFGWLCVAFLVLTLANVLKLFGYEDSVNAVGNILFLSSAIYTLIVAFVAWRRGSRAA